MTDRPSQELEAIVASIKSSRKYRDTFEGTIRAVVKDELRHCKTGKQVEKAARRRLHEIMAFYVGEPDYGAMEVVLRRAFDSGNPAAIKDACACVLTSHVSTRERLAIADRFYPRVFEVTGEPRVLLDLASALNPLMFPWMGLPNTVAYHAYDVHERRVAFINTYFSLQGLEPRAEVQDIAVDIPAEHGDVALFLKELPRFEKNYGGLGLAMIEALRVRYVVISFPTVSLHGGRSLVQRYRGFFREFVAGKAWPVEEIGFENELVFCLDKGTVR
jgi:16S rRNA (guanine(1405)-N(7))-methyltransferase